MASYRLQIITQEKAVFDRTVLSLVAPGVDGYLGVLAHHAPLVTVLGKGQLTVHETREREFVYDLEGGFLEVSNNQATILADALTTVAAPAGERAAEAETA